VKFILCKENKHKNKKAAGELQTARPFWQFEENVSASCQLEAHSDIAM